MQIQVKKGKKVLTVMYRIHQWNDEELKIADRLFDESGPVSEIKDKEARNGGTE